MTTFHYFLVSVGVALGTIVASTIAIAGVLAAIHGTTIQEELKLAGPAPVCTVLGCQVATV